MMTIWKNWVQTKDISRKIMEVCHQTITGGGGARRENTSSITDLRGYLNFSLLNCD